jgi:hypothetical protein
VDEVGTFQVAAGVGEEGEGIPDAELVGVEGLRHDVGAVEGLRAEHGCVAVSA